MGFGVIRHRFHTNMEIYSLIMAWGLDLGETVKIVRKVMEAIVHSDYLEGMESILGWFILGVVLDVHIGLVTA